MMICLSLMVTMQAGTLAEGSEGPVVGVAWRRDQDSESFVGVVQAIKAAGKAAGVIGKYAGLFAKDGLDMAQEYFDDQENRKKLIEMGAGVALKVAAKVIKK